MTFAGLRRTVVGEIMDSPTLDRAEHVRALEGLRRINRASGTVEGILRPLLSFARRRGMKQVRVLDVACGGGDVPIGVAEGMKKAGVHVHLTVSDRSVVALQQAEEVARDHSFSVQTVEGDAVAGLPSGTFDVVTNSLFLHHLERAEVVRVLGHMRAAVRVGGIVIVSDLRRSVGGYVLAWVGCRVLSRSRMVHFDGPVSVRAAWTVEELKGMAVEAGMGEMRNAECGMRKGGALRVERAWPWRILLVWEREGGRD